MVSIGANCSISDYVHIWGGGVVTIGNNVLIATHTVITSLTHDKSASCFRDTLIKQPVQIEDNVWICSGARILSGVTVGSGSIIGAASVVTKDVPPNSIVMGVPGRVVATVSICS
ncbi:acyltransferase [Thiorhodovibrio litoralis]|uniref:acyltransferase n=1 Tax=Thiorhodovibrio litoralis TaxID=2952932 RepID=UPI003899F4EA